MSKSRLFCGLTVGDWAWVAVLSLTWGAFAYVVTWVAVNR